MEDKQKLYTTPQAASMIGVSSSRLRQLIVAGTAKPADQIGGTWLFTLDEIEKLRTRNQKPGRAPKK
jgi:predicted site-specific integrase-resolvase